MELKPVRYRELCLKSQESSQTCSSVYLEGGGGLAEDLIEGYVTRFRREPFSRASFTSAAHLIREVDNIPPDGSYRALIVRDADRVFSAKDHEAVLLRLDRERRNARLRVVFIGAEPRERVREWFLGNKAYGIVTEPSFEKLGAWMATKTAGRWDYRTIIGSLITEEDGLRLMEHVGWDYTAALQAAKTIRAYTDEPIGWDRLSALIPPKSGFGYAEALVFGKGRREALRLAQGIPEHEVKRTLGLVRWYLRQYARLRALEVENMSDRAVVEETGVNLYYWRMKYKPAYARYTNPRIMMRQDLTEELLRVGSTVGALEVLASEW